MRPTDIQEFIEPQDGGALKERIETILSDVATAVIDQGQKGKVDISFAMDQISSSCQVEVTATLKYTRPRSNGDISETYKVKTPMYVNSGGKMTFFSESQGDMFKTKQDKA